MMRVVAKLGRQLGPVALRYRSVERALGHALVRILQGDPRAVLYVHGCHPTALGHENLRLSADWPGAAGREIEAAQGGRTA